MAILQPTSEEKLVNDTERTDTLEYFWSNLKFTQKAAVCFAVLAYLMGVALAVSIMITESVGTGLFFLMAGTFVAGGVALAVGDFT